MESVYFPGRHAEIFASPQNQNPYLICSSLWKSKKRFPSGRDSRTVRTLRQGWTSIVVEPSRKKADACRRRVMGTGGTCNEKIVRAVSADWNLLWHRFIAEKLYVGNIFQPTFFRRYVGDLKGPSDVTQATLYPFRPGFQLRCIALSACRSCLTEGTLSQKKNCN